MSDPESTMMELVSEYKKYHDLVANLKAQLQQAQEIKDEFEIQLYDSMVQEGVQNLKSKLGTFYLRDEDYASILPGQQEDFFQWLRDNGNGDLIKPSIHSRTLTAWVKEATGGGELEEDNELAKFINIFTKHRVGVRGGGK